MLAPRRCAIAACLLAAGFVWTVEAAAPVANDDAYQTSYNSPLTVGAPGVLANDTADPNTTLTATATSQPIYGTLTLNPNGSFTYTPQMGYYGTDSFSYQANDGTSNSNTAVVSLTVMEPTGYGGGMGGGYSSGGGYGGGATAPLTLVLLGLAALYRRGLKLSKRRAISP